MTVSDSGDLTKTTETANDFSVREEIPAENGPFRKSEFEGVNVPAKPVDFSVSPEKHFDYSVEGNEENQNDFSVTPVKPNDFSVGFFRRNDFSVSILWELFGLSILVGLGVTLLIGACAVAWSLLGWYLVPLLVVVTFIATIVAEWS